MIPKHIASTVRTVSGVTALSIADLLGGTVSVVSQSNRAVGPPVDRVRGRTDL